MHLSWFEIPVEHMDRAIAFYEYVFEIKIQRQQFGDTLMGWLPPTGLQNAATGSLI